MPLTPPVLSTAALVINFNTAALTVRCVQSLAVDGVDRILVLDNASEQADYDLLRHSLAESGRCHLFRSEVNLGFAAGSNLLIEKAFAAEACSHVLMVNSDAVLAADGFEALVEVARENEADLIGGRVNRLEVSGGGQLVRTDTVESHGIALYRTLLASNRKHDEEGYLGPTGGCALYSRRMLERVRLAHGHVFDPDYFCYAEDTDLCIRARLLGFSAAKTDAVVAYHQGQASSGGGFSDFVYYHGIRNSIWTLFKSFPVSLLFRNAHWILLLHAGIVVRHTMRGKLRLTLRIYRDGFAAWQPLLAKRRRIFDGVPGNPGRRLNAVVTPWFYEPGYLKGAFRELFTRRRADPRR
ncbi:MAG: glycosyltransferase family 2 protein [Rhodocyclaceae bacterium]|nr:glycosyltransferase family 2 protein [Rhodocyclaceae bacterium]